MAMFSEARRGAEDRMKGMGMGEYGEDPMMAPAPAQDPAAELMGLIEQVPDPALAEALRAAAQKLVGGERQEEAAEGEPLENDPVVGP